MKLKKLHLLNIALFAAFSISTMYSQNKIGTTGDVGIGTTSPKAKLHINGDLFISQGEGFRLFGDPNYFGQYLDGIVLEMQDTNSGSGVTDGGFVFRGFTTKDSVHKDWMVIKTGGKVGILNNDPAYNLDVRGVIHNGASDFILGKYDGRDQGSKTRNRALVHLQNDELHINFNGDFEGGTVIQGSKTYFTGNVGIGKSDPQNKLSVNGTIWAKEVKVSLTDAADWVFEADYKLQPLAEVEAFIKRNKHLPEMPSADEFRANDMKVSEMTNKLLQKIEELTLYTIEQEKAIQAEKENNKALEARLAKLEASLIK